MPLTLSWPSGVLARMFGRQCADSAPAADDTNIFAPLLASAHHWTGVAAAWAAERPGLAILSGLAATFTVSVCVEYLAFWADPATFMNPNTIAYYNPTGAHRRKALSKLQRPTSLATALSNADCPNPFVSSAFGLPPLGPVRQAFRYLAMVTLLPLRTLTLVVLLLIAWAISVVALLGADESKPLRGVRRALVEVVRALFRATVFALGFHHVRVRGRLAPRARAPVLVCNHVSVVDPLYLISCTGGGPVAAVEHTRAPFFGMIMRAIMTIPLDRTSAESRRKCVTDIVDRARSKEPWPQVVIFPEGTTTNGKALVTFKHGAFAAGVPVQPVVIRYPRRGTSDPAWVEAGPSIGAILVNLVCSPVNFMQVTFLPPYDPSPEEAADPALYAANVRRVMAAALGVPATAHTLDDVALMKEARHLHLPVEIAALEMGKLASIFSTSRADVAKNLSRYAEIVPDADAQRAGLTLDQWLRVAGGAACDRCAADAGGVSDDPAAATDLCEALTAAFHLLDVDETGRVDLREWLAGLLVMGAAREGTPERRDEAIKFSWQVLAGAPEARLDAGRLRRVLCLPGNEGELAGTAAMRALDGLVSGKAGGAVTFSEFSNLVRKHPEVLEAFSQRVLLAGPVKAAAAAAASAAPARK